MTRSMALAGAAVAALAAAMSVTAASSPAITPTSIAGVKRGLTVAAYKQLLGGPSHIERARKGSLVGFDQPEHWSRLVFPRRKVQAFFDGGTKAVLVTTWNKHDRTAAGIGPCSTVAQLKRAYGKTITPSKFNTQGGNVYVYTKGDLIFGAPNLVDVTAVGLYDSQAPDANRAGGSLSYAGFVMLADQVPVSRSSTTGRSGRTRRPCCTRGASSRPSPRRSRSRGCRRCSAAGRAASPSAAEAGCGSSRPERGRAR